MPSSSRVSIFVFIDAFGWALLQRHPFLEDLLPERGPLATVFGYSSTCDPTILTGVPPREHGHFSFFRYNPARSPFRGFPALELLPRSLTSRARVRHLISRLARRLLGYTGYFQLYNVPFRFLPLFEYTERRDLYAPGGINGGCDTVFDALRRHRVPFHLSDWRTGEVANLAAAKAALREERPALMYLYLAEMDALLHREGTWSSAVGRKIMWYDQQLRELLAAAREEYDEVALHVFSDHGMTDVVATCDLRARIEGLGLRFGRDYAVMYDSTMARFWFLRPDVRRRVESALRQEPHGRILSESELAAFGCDFPDASYGELFFLLNPGVLLVPSFMGERPVAGMHGYDPDHPDSVAMYASTESGRWRPRALADLHDLMLRSVELAA